MCAGGGNVRQKHAIYRILGVNFVHFIVFREDFSFILS